MNLQIIENYTDKSFIVIGETYKVKEDLKKIGGSFNTFLKYQGLIVTGWVFSKRRITEVQEFIKQFVPVVPEIVAKPTIQNQRVEIIPEPSINAVIESFTKKAGKRYANKYIELCNEANVCVVHAITNNIMRRKLNEFKNALEINTVKNRKKEYHKPKFKDSPFNGRLIVKKGESMNIIETTFKNSEALEKLMKQLSKEAEEQRVFISFKYEQI